MYAPAQVHERCLPFINKKKLKKLKVTILSSRNGWKLYFFPLHRKKQVRFWSFYMIISTPTMEMDPVLLYMISHCNHAGEEMQIVVVMGLVVSLPDQASIWKFRYPTQNKFWIKSFV